jgi:hypothetical protein
VGLPTQLAADYVAHEPVHRNGEVAVQGDYEFKQKVNEASLLRQLDAVEAYFKPMGIATAGYFQWAQK